MQTISADKNLKVITSESQFGGLIGPDNSRLHTVLHNFKLRVNAAFHDACGFTTTHNKLEPGYV